MAGQTPRKKTIVNKWDKLNFIPPFYNLTKTNVSSKIVYKQYKMGFGQKCYKKNFRSFFKNKKGEKDHYK